MKFSPFHIVKADGKLAKSRLAGRGFTMIEIAICLAIIGIALVAIIGVLPLGMNVQRDNGQETIINQDASVLLEAVRNGSVAQDDLTNYVYAITNYCGEYASKFSGETPISYGTTNLHSGAEIVGMLSTPQYLSLNTFQPVNDLYNGGYSNHIVAYIRSLSGIAVEKPPQNNDILRQDAFSYRVYFVNQSLALDTNVYANPAAYEKQLLANLHEVRLRFFYPKLPSGNFGGSTLTYRTMVSGSIDLVTNYIADKGVLLPYLYFYQPQTFTNAP